MRSALSIDGRTSAGPPLHSPGAAIDPLQSHCHMLLQQDRHVSLHCSVLSRHRYITPDIMTTVLQGAAGRAAKHYEQYYQQLRELLSYLNLPGPVSRWLPPISLVRISHFNVLTFLSNYKELEYDYKVKMLAEHAVQQMLSYQPFVGETPPNSTDCISGVVANHARFTPRSTAFAIAYDASRGVDGPLRVYAVNDARNQLATRYDHWLEGVKAGSYGKDDSIIWDGERERSSSGARVKDLHFVELTPGVSAPLSIAEVGVQRFVGCVDTRPDVVLVGPTSDPPGTPETLAGHIRAMFGRLAESAALMLVNYTISINPTMKQLMDRLSFDRYEIRLWAICW